MANKYENEKRRVTKIKLILSLALFAVCLISLVFSNSIEKLLKIGKYTSTNVANFTVVDSCGLKVHYIDVGQGDSTLIELPDGTTMLIDAGTPNTKLTNNLINYLKTTCEIQTIDYLVLTHSDDDHSGGMARVFEEFEIKNVYRPFQLACHKNQGGNPIGAPIEAEDLSAYYIDSQNFNDWIIKQVTELEYCDFITAAYSEQWTDEGGNKHDASVTVSYQGLTIESVDEDVDFSIEFFAPFTTAEVALLGAEKTGGRPVKVYKDDNNASPIIMLEYKDMNFVWTGDAENEVESDFVSICNSNTAIKTKFSNVEVYKAGHHGSSSSSTSDFLEIINPMYTICSCGENNKYGHPSQAFLERWETQMQAQGASRKLNNPLRTDLNKTIIFGVSNEGELVYCSGVNASEFVIYWWYIDVVIFVVGITFILSLRIYRNSVSKTAKSAKSSIKSAKKTAKSIKY